MPGVTSLSLVSGYESVSSTSSTHHDAVVDEDLQVTAVTPVPTRLASNVNAGCDLWEFWVDHKEELPRWHGVAKKIALIQPSSAFMERAFSILRAYMDERQASSFSDRVAAAALLKYNRGRGT